MNAGIVDLHCHLATPMVEDLLGAHPARLAGFRAMDQAQGVTSAAVSNAMLATVKSALAGTDERLRQMDARGIARQVLSPSPAQYYYWADEKLSQQIVRITNEHIAGVCDRHPQRFDGLGTVALQHPALAIAQLEQVIGELGLRGVEISSHVEGVSLADERNEPFWAACERLGALVLLHPLGTTLGNRLANHYLWNVVGQPLETTIALSELILGGVLDRYPSLRLIACHGGGYLGAYWGRIDHAWWVRPDCGVCARRPSDYLRQIFVDTVVHDPVQLRQLIDAHGVEQIVAGTDYPFDMGVADLAGLLDAVPGLTAQERHHIEVGNAERLLGRAVTA